MDITSLRNFLIGHEYLGIWYQPLMGFFMLMIASPLWIAYIIACFASYYSYTALSAYYNKAYRLDYIIRYSLDGLYNPCALPLYYTYLNYFYSKQAYISLFGWPIMPLYYSNSLSLQSLYPHTYCLIVIIAYHMWFSIQSAVLQRFVPGHTYKYQIQTRILAPTRLLGACGLMIVLADFDPVIDKVLYMNVCIGAFLSVSVYCWRVYHLFNPR